MIYAYLRLSTDESKQSNSFDIQLNHINKEYEIDEVFKDILSGTTPFDKRTGWLHLMSIIKSGDTIVIHRMDRLSRDTLNYLVVNNHLEKMGVHIKFIDGVSGDTPMDKMVRTILSAVGEMERSLIALRVKQSKQHLKSKGKYLGGVVPFGYKVEDTYLIDDPQEQTIIQTVLNLREDGYSYRRVTNELSKLGMTTRKGTEFSLIQLQRIVKGYKE